VYYVVDFLDPELLQVDIKQVILLYRKIFNKEFGLNFSSTVVLKTMKIGFMSDCGLYVGCFLYKSLFCNYLDEITIKEQDKDRFFNRFL